MVRKVPDMEEAHVNKEVNNAHALTSRKPYTMAELSRIKADQR